MLAALCTLSSILASTGRVTLEPDVAAHLSAEDGGSSNWRRVSRAPINQELNLVVVLRKTPAQLSALDASLMQVSDPRSPSYGNHFSMDKLRDTHFSSAAGPKALEVIIQWLQEWNATRVASNHYGDLVSFKMTARNIESMLETKLSVYSHTGMPNVAITRASLPYSVPTEIAGAVSMVGELLQFPALRYNPISRKNSNIIRKNHISTSGEADWPTDCGQKCANKGTGLIGKGITPAVLAMRYALGDPPAIGTVKGSVAVAEFTNVYWDQRDLDLFTTACNTTGRFAGYNTSVQHMIGPENKPKKCDVSVIIGPDMCKEALLDITTLKGVAGPIPLTDIYNQDYSLLDWAKQVNDMDNDTLPLVHSVSYENDEGQQSGSAYMEAVNTELAKLGLRGITALFASGDQGAQVVGATLKYADLYGTNKKYQAGFPSTSPYITSVGGTNFATKDVIGDEECWTGSGGGFSREFSRPAYQQQAVGAYLSQLGQLNASSKIKPPPASSYNGTGRAVPDISALGGEQNQYCLDMKGKLITAYGTSAATPVVAGVVAKLNELRLARGSSPMGFLNPFLYSASQSHPDAFHDVIIGRNSQGTTKAFDDIGFPALPGWDACTGLGTPNFSVLSQAAVAVGNSQKD